MKDLFPVRIGLLFGQAPAPHEEKELLEGLREHGLVDGDNLIIERRYAEGQLHLVPGYGRDLGITLPRTLLPGADAVIR